MIQLNRVDDLPAKPKNTRRDSCSHIVSVSECLENLRFTVTYAEQLALLYLRLRHKSRNAVRETRLSNMSKVTALILHYLKSELTISCIQALHSKVEAVVIVDNSGDQGSSWKIVESALSESGIRGIHVLDAGRNLGFAKGVNFGLDYISKADIPRDVLLLNNDAIVSEYAVQNLVACLQRHPQKTLILAEIKRNQIDERMYYQKYFALLTQRPYWGSFSYVSGCCTLIPSSLISSKLFDEDFFFYGEDIELGFRLQKQGVNGVVAPNTHVDHLGSASSKAGSPFYEYNMVFGHWLLVDKLSQGYLEKLTLIAGRMIALPLRACVRAIRQKTLVPIKQTWKATADFMRR